MPHIPRFNNVLKFISARFKVGGPLTSSMDESGRVGSKIATVMLQPDK